MSLSADKDALREMAFAYAQAVDHCDGDALVKLFTVDGMVCGMDSDIPPFVGDEGLRQMIHQVDVSFVKTMHNVFNQTFVIAVGSLAATGETTCIASHIIAEADGTWQVMDMAIRYHNDFTREPNGWKYRRRRLDVQWIETRPVKKMRPDMLENKA
jgi:ketosteroid isomerase-like protein